MIYPFLFITAIVALSRQFAPNGADLIDAGNTPTPAPGKVILPIDGGWARFRFALMGPAVSYIVPAGYSGYIELVVTDAFCPGDSFSVYFNDRLILQTPLVAIPETCEFEIQDPEEALKDPAFSSARARVSAQSGDKITIAPRASALSAGRAFLRASSILQTLSVGPDNVYIVTSPRVPRRMASNICNLLQSRLAYPDEEGLSDSIVRAGLSSRSVWTAATTGTFQGNCPAYSVDASGKLVGGSIPCDDGLAVACSSSF